LFADSEKGFQRRTFQYHR